MLVVDDDRSTQVLLEELLRRLNLEISLASDGAEGLRLADEKSFALVIADLRMPHVTGGEMLRALELTRSRGSHRIVFSGAGEYVDRIAPPSLACARIAKPFDLRLFLAQVERCLSETAIHHRNPAPALPAEPSLNRGSGPARP
ncbi:MAG: response regulator [Acidobacteria bacterium]|nr:response regulator [Acidobacteriota bacterium]